MSSPAAAPAPAPRSVGWAAVAVAVALSASPLTSGFFDFSAWGVVALASMVLLVVLGGVARPSFPRHALVAGGGLGALLALSGASLLWAESRESAWTSFNRLALYGVVFAIVLLAVRERRTGRLVVLVLGSAALLTSLWLCASFLLGGSQGAFLSRRLDSPIGYVNGTAGLLVMGLWPWIAYAEGGPRPLARAGALAGAALIAGTLVLTQSRAVLPAMLVAGALVALCDGGRVRRAINLILVGGAVAVGLPWSLAVYSDGGLAARMLAPSHPVLRAAGAAVLGAALGAGLVRLALSHLFAAVEVERRRLLLRRVGRGLAAAAAAAAAAGLGLGGASIEGQYRAFTAVRVNENVSVRFVDASGFRYDLWRVAAREFAAHPLGGLGAGNYDVEYYRRRQNPQAVLQPHSLELQMAAELGVGGVAALVVFCGAVFRACLLRRGTLASGDPVLSVAAAGMFAAWLLDTSVDWIYDIPGLTGMAMVAAALLVAPSVGRARAGAGGRRGRVAAASGLAVVAVLAASVGRQYAASRYAQSASGQIARSPKSALAGLRMARGLDPFSLGTLYWIGAAYARENDYADARAALTAAALREPHNYVPPALLGDLALRRGLSAEAIADYRRALALNPREPGLRAAAAAGR